MTMSAPSLQIDLAQTEFPWMSSAAVSRVRILAEPAQDEGSAASVRGSGGKWRAWLASFDLSGFSWRTSQTFLKVNGELGLAEFSETWPRSGMTRNGTAYRLPPLVPLMRGTGSGSLPTPTRSMGKRGWGFSTTSKQRYRPEVMRTALAYGWKPPALLLEWAMGYPEDFTAVSEPKSSGTALPQKSQK